MMLRGRLGWAVVWALGSLLGVVGCGGSSSSSDDTSSSAASGSTRSSGSGSTGTSGGSTAGSGDLSGTWDLIISDSDGDASTATVTVSPSLLEVVGEGVELLAIIGANDINVAYDNEAVDATRLSPANVDLGIFPLPLSGSLHFSSAGGDGSCDTSLQAESFTLTCTGGIHAGGDLPRLDNADASASKASSLPSVFGDLGGRWSYQDERTNCSLTLEGNSITVDCTGARTYTGNATLTVDGDRISGSTNGGIEFTAQRR